MAPIWHIPKSKRYPLGQLEQFLKPGPLHVKQLLSHLWAKAQLIKSLIHLHGGRYIYHQALNDLKLILPLKITKSPFLIGLITLEETWPIDTGAQGDKACLRYRSVILKALGYVWGGTGVVDMSNLVRFRSLVPMSKCRCGVVPLES